MLLWFLLYDYGKTGKTLDYSDVFHCEPIEKVADDFIQKNNILYGKYDNVLKCKYTVPDYWDIGEVFARLIEDCYEENNVITGIKEVYP